MATKTQISHIAEGYYSQKLLYHNFGHATTVAKAARLLCGYCKAHGVKVDEAMVELACLFHDAGYHEDHEALGYPSKEAYSAAIARRELERLGYDEHTIEAAAHAILCTKVDDEALCQAPEDFVVRLADVYNVTEDYAVFMDNNSRFKSEVEMLSGKPIAEADWKASTHQILGQYITDRLALTDEARAAIARGKANIARYTGQPL